MPNLPLPPRAGPRTFLALAWMVCTGATPVLAKGSPCPGDADPALSDLLRNRLEATRTDGVMTAGGERVRAVVALPEFYLRRQDAPAWVDARGPSRCAERLRAALDGAGADGLDPADYHLAAIDSLARTAAATGGQAWVDLDLLLTDAYLTFGSHLLQGRVNPATLQPEWLANRRSADMAANLDSALAAGDVETALDRLRPQQQGYRILRRRLAELRQIQAAGGWGVVPEGATLHPGDVDPRVPLLRRRLALGGDLMARATPGRSPAELYDEEVASALQAFQRRHGLDDDGNLGKETLAALNVPAEDRIEQVIVNLERWRWLPADLGQRHIRVNIADYHVEVWDSGKIALQMRAVVGREYRQTPVFSAEMTYIVLSPYWHVPPLIAALDKLPILKKDPGYLAEQKMTLLSQATNQPVDPQSVDWAALTGPQFNRLYRIRQDPGPLNALGQVKFMFPNKYNVYLHDTPSRELFSKSSRAFSSGCVRLQKPLELADYLLAGDPRWTPERIRATIAERKETTVWLSTPVPVHILYWTAFVEDDGVVNFRPDIYGRDQAVRRALNADPPPS